MSDADDKEKRRKKQAKRMTKLVSAAWEWNEAFRTSSELPNALYLEDIGRKIDRNEYKLGRHGWEDFALDFGGVFHSHVAK